MSSAFELLKEVLESGREIEMDGADKTKPIGPMFGLDSLEIVELTLEIEDRFDPSLNINIELEKYLDDRDLHFMDITINHLEEMIRQSVPSCR